MTPWQSYLRSDPTDWLLDPKDPSVRYFTLRELYNRPAKDPEVAEARSALMKNGPVPAILSRQASGGFWGKAEDFYIRSKYRGTVWQFIILAELGADGCDERIQRACEFILAASQDRISHGFAFRAADLVGGDHEAVLPCLTGNMLFSLARLGYLNDPRVQAGFQWAVRYQRADDGTTRVPDGWPYDISQKCWGKHTCHMGVVKVLKALAEIPADQRSEDVQGLIQTLAEHLLKHQIYKSSHDPSKVTMPHWLQYGFPLMYNTDVLEVLEILTRLGYHDSRMEPAIGHLVSKQDEQGRWTLETTFNDRFIVGIEHKGRPSKWVTLNALKVIKRYYGERNGL